MKKSILLLVVCFSLMSCEKVFLEDDNLYPETETIDLNITIKNSEIYEYDLGQFAINEGAEFDTLGDHFEISELNRDNNGRIIYKYKAQSNYVGTDFVAITTGSNYSDGIVFKQETFIRIFFDVID